MIARPERAAVTTLARAPWAAGVVFSFAIHAALAAFVVGQSAQAPSVGSAVVVDVVLVDGPDATPAADPAAPALVVEAPGAQDTPQDEPAAPDAVQATADKRPEIVPPTAVHVTPRPRPVGLAGPEKTLSKDAARATANAAAEKKPDEAQITPKNMPLKRNIATKDKIEDTGLPTQTGPPAQKAALPSGASRGASPLAGNPKPAYPRLARRRNQEGRVLLRVLVMPDGGGGAVTVVESSGHGTLDRAAVAAVSTWRFRPATRAGRAVTSVLEIPVRFRLRQDAE